MRRLVVAMIALASVVSITPGVRELVLDAAHLALGGHVAHDECTDAEADEHGCTGAFHTCACHASASMTTPAFTLHVETVVPLGRLIVYAVTEARRGPNGFTRLLVRPPSA